MTTQPQPDALRLAGALLEPVVLDKHAMQASDELLRLHAECEAVKKELETERVRLAACGVIAMSNTPESAARARYMLPMYRSASADDVANAVDREMALRGECKALRADAERLHAECEALRADAERGRWLVDWLEQTGLVSVLFCQPDAGMRAEDWFVLWRPYGVDRTRSPEGYAKTPEGAIDAARAAKEQSK